MRFNQCPDFANKHLYLSFQHSDATRQQRLADIVPVVSYRKQPLEFGAQSPDLRSDLLGSFLLSFASG
ncbi:hypothetical protein G3N57_00715 [Paraburkholderia sp. Se-20369]|nr:hypothetical protein [Paraburkholderia sp. Se-20369]